MSNPMKYIRDLEAVGFERDQAEAQVTMVLDAIKGDLVTKTEFAVFQERIENRLVQHEQRIDARFDQFEQRIDARFHQSEQRIDARFEQVDARFDQQDLRFERRIVESDFRMLTRMGLLVVSTSTIVVAVLTWLIKT
jgi:hypothetical protein